MKWNLRLQQNVKNPVIFSKVQTLKIKKKKCTQGSLELLLRQYKYGAKDINIYKHVSFQNQILSYNK